MPRALPLVVCRRPWSSPARLGSSSSAFVVTIVCHPSAKGEDKKFHDETANTKWLRGCRLEHSATMINATEAFHDSISYPRGSRSDATRSWLRRPRLINNCNLIASSRVKLMRFFAVMRLMGFHDSTERWLRQTRRQSFLSQGKIRPQGLFLVSRIFLFACQP